jgi:outer membrane protein
MRKLFVFIAILGLIVPFTSFSQEIKIGYVNALEVYDKYTKTEDYDKVLEEKRIKEEEKLLKKKDEIEKMQSKLSLLKEDEQKKKQEEIAVAVNEFRTLEREIYIDLKKERDERMQELFEDINVVIKDYAQKNNFTLVLNETIVLYGQDTMDVTEDILNLMNEGYKK